MRIYHYLSSSSSCQIQFVKLCKCKFVISPQAENTDLPANNSFIRLGRQIRLEASPLDPFVHYGLGLV